MWDDRLLFVIAAMTAIAIVFGKQISRLQQTIRVGGQTIKLRWIIVGAITVLLILVLGSHIWSHRHQSTLPNATSLVAIVVGAIFGTFTGRFVAGLFSARFGRRDPIIGASVLVLLIIAYSLPLYSSAISELISGIGLSNVKTPFLELTCVNGVAKVSPQHREHHRIQGRFLGPVIHFLGSIGSVWIPSLMLTPRRIVHRLRTRSTLKL